MTSLTHGIKMYYLKEVEMSSTSTSILVFSFQTILHVFSYIFSLTHILKKLKTVV